MGKRRYVLHPGYVFSRTDDDPHFIGARKLAELYKVPWQECFVASGLPGERYDQPDLVHLSPRYNGDYALPGHPTHNGGESE